MLCFLLLWTRLYLTLRHACQVWSWSGDQVWPGCHHQVLQPKSTQVEPPRTAIRFVECEAGELRSNKNCQVPGTQPSGAWRWAQLASLERWLPSRFDRGNLFCQAWISEAAQWSLCYRVQCQQLLWRWRVRIPSAIDAVYEWNFHNLSRLSLLRNFGAVIVLSAANFPRYEVFELCPQNFLWGAVAIQKGNQGVVGYLEIEMHRNAVNVAWTENTKKQSLGSLLWGTLQLLWRNYQQ